MGSMDGMRTASERHASALTARPSMGQKTFVTTVRVQEGLTCVIEDGPWRLTADFPQALGGNAAGPTPGTFGRAALGSCLAICYVLWGARLGVPLADVAVEVRADADTRGILGLNDVPPGYTDVQYIVSVTSPAPAEDVLRVLEMAEAHSPYMDVFSRPHTLRRLVRITATEE